MQYFQQLSVRMSLKVLFWLAGVAVLAVIIATIAFVAFREVNNVGEARKYTSEVVTRASAVLADLKDAETGTRGYALTADIKFLEPYTAVREGIVGRFQALRALTSDAAGKKRLDNVGPLIDARLVAMANVIDQRGRDDTVNMLADISAGVGKRLMDQIRVELNAYIQVERELLAKLESEFRSNIQFLFAIIVAACLLTLVFAVGFAFLLRRETQYDLQNRVFAETQHMLRMQEESNRALSLANAALRVSEERLQVTLNSIGDAVIATDADGLVTILNPLGEHLTGWVNTDAVGRPIEEVFKIINQTTRLPVSIPVRQTLADGTIQSLANHTLLISRDNTECSIADSCAPIRGHDGEVVGSVLVFRDVTAEDSTSRAMRDGNAQIQAIFNTVGEGIITVRVGSGTVERANLAAEKMFGYPPSGFVGVKFDALIPEVSVDRDIDLVEYFSAPDAATAAGLGRETLGLRPDGSSFPLEIAVRELWLGGIRYITCILRDISTRKRIADSLLKTSALQDAIFNSANFSSIATDDKGVIQIFNVGAERMLGYAASEVINKITPADISDPEEVIVRATALSAELSIAIKPGFEALVFKASRGIEDIYELSYIRKDGSRFPAIVSVTALRDAQDAIIGYLLIGTDNTARKLVEAEQMKLDQRLRDQQFYSRSLIESNIDAIMTTDPSGIITDVNKQTEILTGCTRDELIGAPFKNYFTDAARAEASIKLVLSEKKVTNYELTARHRDGKETVVSYNANTFYDRDRNLQGVFAAARDITERKRLDLALKDTHTALESAKFVAEKANLAKSDFLSSMSHELRSPLNAILGFAQLMDSDEPEPTASQRASIAQILNAGRFLLELINEILDLAVVESGKLSLSEEPVALDDVMLECRSMIEPTAQQRGIAMHFPNFDKLTFVRADRTRLKQAVINLLSNAIKYNRPNGAVTVTCSQPSAARTRISIRDGGAGLSPDKLAQLFQPFNRLGQEGGGVEGTGIGLVMSKRIVHAMGGEIGVESTVGSGSVFWIELDSVGSPQLAKPKPVAASVSGKHYPVRPARTLLYIEDNPANLALVEQLIRRRPDMHLLTAVNADIGIALARSAQPNLILMDINLPGMNGTQAMKILTNDPSTSHIPVMALSANAMPGDIKRGLEDGFVRYLTKPIDVNEFMASLDSALQAA